MYNNMVKRNHFVSRGYLRFFCNDDEKILVYDKESKNCYTTTVDNICVKRNIYNAVENNEEISWETFYTEIDKNVPNIIRKIKQNCEINIMDKPFQVGNIKQDIALIMIIQMLRTPERIFSQTELYNEILDSFMKELNDNNVSDKEEKIKIIQKYNSKEYYKGIALRGINMPEQLIKYANILLTKTWVIYKNNTRNKFITSDNPVILYNFINKSIGMENGIGRKDTIILYPITPQYLIELFPKQYLFGKVFELYNNKCILLKEDNFVDNMNKLQYKNSNRQIYGKLR